MYRSSTCGSQLLPPTQLPVVSVTSRQNLSLPSRFGLSYPEPAKCPSETEPLFWRNPPDPTTGSQILILNRLMLPWLFQIWLNLVTFLIFTLTAARMAGGISTFFFSLLSDGIGGSGMPLLNAAAFCAIVPSSSNPTALLNSSKLIYPSLSLSNSLMNPIRSTWSSFKPSHSSPLLRSSKLRRPSRSRSMAAKQSRGYIPRDLSKAVILPDAIL
mmetsp:Transcript_19958/g.55518  ORF Transcript_19958/g.55518 Transcript_19958/m.55518 type:complete len:214 (-) Transcript_19958:362-1003(-)